MFFTSIKVASSWRTPLQVAPVESKPRLALPKIYFIFKGTNAINLSISFYSVNQKPVDHRINFLHETKRLACCSRLNLAFSLCIM